VKATKKIKEHRIIRGKKIVSKIENSHIIPASFKNYTQTTIWKLSIVIKLMSQTPKVTETKL
jgi:hypothetical protein